MDVFQVDQCVFPFQEEEKKPEEEKEVGQPAKAERVVQRRGRWGTRTETRTHTRRTKRSTGEDDAYM